MSRPRSRPPSRRNVNVSAARPAEQERQLKYAKWRTYQCSHLLENIKHEFLDTEGQVDDHYLVEKVMITREPASVLVGPRVAGGPEAAGDGGVTGGVRRRDSFVSGCSPVMSSRLETLPGRVMSERLRGPGQRLSVARVSKRPPLRCIRGGRGAAIPERGSLLRG